MKKDTLVTDENIKFFSELYLRLAKPFRETGLYCPPSLEHFLAFTRETINYDQDIVGFCQKTKHILYKINEALFPEEVATLHDKDMTSIGNRVSFPDPTFFIIK